MMFFRSKDEPPPPAPGIPMPGGITPLPWSCVIAPSANSTSMPATVTKRDWSSLTAV